MLIFINFLGAFGTFSMAEILVFVPFQDFVHNNFLILFNNVLITGFLDIHKILMSLKLRNNVFEEIS